MSDPAMRVAALRVAALKVTELARGLRWYLREVSGESLYGRYMERHRCEHPGEPAMTRREFEHWRIDRAGLDPGSRCC